jgi:hypothetical protein
VVTNVAGRVPRWFCFGIDSRSSKILEPNVETSKCPRNEGRTHGSLLKYEANVWFVNCSAKDSGVSRPTIVAGDLVTGYVKMVVGSVGEKSGFSQSRR